MTGLALPTKKAGDIFSDIHPAVVQYDDKIIGSTKSFNIIKAGPGDDVLVAGSGIFAQSDMLYGEKGRDGFNLATLEV